MGIERTVTVRLSERSYDIDVAPGLLGQLGGRTSQRLRPTRAIVITDTNVIPHAQRAVGQLNTVGLATSLLSRMLQSVDHATPRRRRRTYPGFLPLLPLDHIYYRGPLEVVSVEQPRTRLALVASDHLQLVAEFAVRS